MTGRKPRSPAGRLLSVNQLAERLQVSRTTVYRLIQNKGMPAVRIGHVLRFDFDAVMAWAGAFTKSGDKLRWQDSAPATAEQRSRSAGPPPSRARASTAAPPPSRRRMAKTVEQATPAPVLEPLLAVGAAPLALSPAPLRRPDPRRVRRLINPGAEGESHGSA